MRPFTWLLRLHHGYGWAWSPLSSLKAPRPHTSAVTREPRNSSVEASESGMQVSWVTGSCNMTLNPINCKPTSMKQSRPTLPYLPPPMAIDLRRRQLFSHSPLKEPPGRKRTSWVQPPQEPIPPEEPIWPKPKEPTGLKPEEPTGPNYLIAERRGREPPPADPPG